MFNALLLSSDVKIVKIYTGPMENFKNIENR